jgi:cytoskeletal protein RodZ
MTSKDLGRIFKEARSEKGFSIREAAFQSRIHDNVIKDIETGDFERLGRVYIKGFIKKYSEFLDLDTSDMVQKFTDLSSSIEDRKLR